MKKINKIVICFFVFLLLFVFVDNSFALHFRIDKGKIRVTLPKGWSDGGIITVENLTADPVDIRVYAGDWVYSDQDGSKDFLPANSQPNSCTDWLKFYPADFRLPPRGKQEVNYVIAIPQDVSGGYYSVLFLEAETGTAVNPEGVLVKVYNRIASLFYVEPEGTINRKAEISDVKVFKSEGTIDIKAKFSNTGNTDIDTKGLYDLIDAEGVVFSRGEFNNVYTMAQGKAELSAKGEGVKLTAGNYDLVLTFNLSEDILVKEYLIKVSSSGDIESVKETE